MASAAHVNTLQDYIIQAMPVLSKISGFFEIVNADKKRYDVVAGAYPDAAFTAMIINNLFHHDREFSEIHQQAFSSIVDGATIPSKLPAFNAKICADATIFAWMLIGKNIYGMIKLWSSLKSRRVPIKS